MSDKKGEKSMNVELFKELAQNNDFLAELFQKKNAEDVKAFLAEKGADFSLDEVRELGRALGAALRSDNELGEDELDHVAGGVPDWAGEVIHDVCKNGDAVEVALRVYAREAWDVLTSW